MINTPLKPQRPPFCSYFSFSLSSAPLPNMAPDLLPRRNENCHGNRYSLSKHCLFFIYYLYFVLLHQKTYLMKLISKYDIGDFPSSLIKVIKNEKNVVKKFIRG